ncbi:HK97-gp10 family putative phage morphogenesis protein [Lysinibacillus sp. NPDC093210]|uniref:HK97-gp10 family putative phage morphogenesis protein n=1 Tax=Lysinibacillus sp. NPDC093210 TaxID=3364133 RepID=UPI0037F81F11
MNIEFSGLQELQREIERSLNPENIVNPTLIKGAEHLRDKLEESVYRFGLRKRTGKSEESMVIDEKIVDGTITIGVSNQANDAFYLYFHEWGTSKIRSRPWMRPTFENEMNRIIEIMKDEVRARMHL